MTSHPHPSAPQAVIVVLLLSSCGGMKDRGACRYNTPRNGATAPYFSFTVTLPDGSGQSCAMPLPTGDGGASYLWPGPLTGEISGWVSAVGGTTFSVDTCLAGTGCSTNVYRFAIDLADVTLAFPPGREVTVSWWLESAAFSCAQVLVVRDGPSSPTPSGSALPLWLAGADSIVEGQIPLPFSIVRQALHCNLSPSRDQGCGGNDVPPDDYELVFAPASGEPPLALATGETGILALTVGGQSHHLKVRVLRAYQTLVCDDYANWAWWAAAHAGPSGQPE